MSAFLLFMRGKWGWAAALALLVSLHLTRETLGEVKGQRDAEIAAHHLTVANYRAAAEKARANDLANAAKVKAQYDRLAQEKQRAIETQLADARVAAARYLERMRSPGQADRGGGGGTDLPGTPGTPVDPAPTGELALVPAPDLDICAVNTVIARGWQEWWAGATAVER